jgi:hypothetical protein
VKPEQPVTRTHLTRFYMGVFRRLSLAFSGGFVEENPQGINSIIFVDWFDYYGIRV